LQHRLAWQLGSLMLSGLKDMDAWLLGQIAAQQLSHLAAWWLDVSTVWWPTVWWLDSGEWGSPWLVDGAPLGLAVQLL